MTTTANEGGDIITYAEDENVHGRVKRLVPYTNQPLQLVMCKVVKPIGKKAAAISVVGWPLVPFKLFGLLKLCPKAIIKPS